MQLINRGAQILDCLFGCCSFDKPWYQETVVLETRDVQNNGLEKKEVWRTAVLTIPLFSKLQGL